MLILKLTCGYDFVLFSPSLIIHDFLNYHNNHHHHRHRYHHHRSQHRQHNVVNTGHHRHYN